MSRVRHLGGMDAHVDTLESIDWDGQSLLSYWDYCCCCYSVTKLCLTLCDPANCSMPGFPVLHHLLEFAQIPVRWVGNAIQPSHVRWWVGDAIQPSHVCWWVGDATQPSHVCWWVGDAIQPSHVCWWVCDTIQPSHVCWWTGDAIQPSHPLPPPFFCLHKRELETKAHLLEGWVWSFNKWGRIIWSYVHEKMCLSS